MQDVMILRHAEFMTWNAHRNTGHMWGEPRFTGPVLQKIYAFLVVNLNEAYRKTSSISRTESQNVNVSCILLQLSSLNLLKPGVQLGMKM